MAKKVSNKTSYYAIVYRDPREGSIQRLKARKIQDSSLGLSFIAVSDFVFDTESLVVNPEEEALALRFETVKMLHLSIYSIIAIEEVGEKLPDLAFKGDKSELKIIGTEFDA